MSPVSVDSIKASYGLGDDDNRTKAKKAVRIYSIFTLTVLFSLIVLQAYWFIGESMTKDIGDLRTARQEIQLNMRAVDLRKKIAEESRGQLREDLIQMQESLRVMEEGDNDRDQLITQINAIKENMKKTRPQQMQEDFEIERVRLSGELEIKNINDKLEGSYKFLDAWDFYSERLDHILGVATETPTLGGAKEAQALGVARGAQASLDAIRQPDASMQQEAVQRLQQAGMHDAGAALSAQRDLERKKQQLRQQQAQLLQQQEQQQKGRKREMALLATKSVLGIFNQYLLPLLYGLLGSLAYILRTLTREIHEVTYTRDSNVGYRLRWPLGMLAGVTIGWFFDPDTLEGTASITPLGLAFLAGYSVELLFTGLDRVVGAFTGPPGQKGQASA